MATSMDKMEYSAGAAGPQFDPYSEPNTVGERWKVWRRNFQYYVDGQIGLGDKQKISRLLHQAGPAVQEIYESLKDEEAEGDNEYERCMNRLDSYFSPEVNVSYERQKFRNISKRSTETLDQFVIRLRNQAKYCDFFDQEEAIRDQIIEKCDDLVLKRKFIKKGKEMTIRKMLEMARIIEIEKSITNKEEEHKDVTQATEELNQIKGSTTCYRCGRRGHIAVNTECPAKQENCNKCGLKGHFAKCCKTKSAQNKSEKKKKKGRKQIRYIVEDISSSGEDEDSECEGESEVNSIFQINSETDKWDIKVGEKPTTSCKFIVDSGATVNVIDRHTFKRLIDAGLDCKLVNCQKKYYSYGGKEISKLGVFETVLFSPHTDVKVKTEILVFKGQGPSLLSRDISVRLGLLRVGPKNFVNLADNYFDKENIVKKFPKLFEGVGKLKDFKLNIPIDPTIKLVAQPVRRQPFNIRHIEQKLINELLDNDIIEPVTGPTPCVSPSHIVAKKEKGQYRLVVDMRKANEAVLRERVPLPTFEELLADLNGCKVFSSIDIKWGYHQVELDEESRRITVFSSSLGLFRYKRLFFGIRCASEMFQRVVAHLLQGIEGVANSQDDIRIGGKTRAEHDQRLQQVLDRLYAAGITLNEKKCSFGVTEINFLGHHLSADGIRPTTTSQNVIQEFRAPENKSEVRSFLGLVNFSARFIPNFSTLTEPLRDLTRKDTEFVWSTKHEQAFQNLKKLIVKAPALGYFDKDAETILITDASPVGVAAVLVQQQVINQHKQPIVIKYVSKALSPTEQRYSQTEKEALAIVWACENLYMYLIGKKFTIISDHKPLEVIYSTNSKPSARIQRWVLRLQPYTFKVVYKPGKSNIADPVSRLLSAGTEQARNTEDSEDSLLLALIEASVEAITINKIQEHTLKDEKLLQLRTAIEKDQWPKDLRKYELIKTELCIINDIILRGTRIVVPTDLIPRMLSLAHEGHLSINSMKKKLRCKVWWSGMDKDVEYWVDTCEGCRLVRKEIHSEPIVPTELPSRVWELVGIDYLGPLPSGHYLLVVIDYYSRYFEVKIQRNQTADSTIKALEEIILREGIMDEVICDNGPAFRDEGFKQFLKTNGIKLRHTTPLWPQANGEVERQNRNLLRRLRIAQGLKLDWKQELMKYLMAYRTTPHSTTGVPPGNLFRGRNIKTKIPEMTLHTDLDDEEIRDTDRYRKHVYKQYADKRRHSKPTDLAAGDKVLLKQRKENKLSTTFSPTKHTVIWKSGNSVAVQSPEGKIIRRNSSYFQPVKERDMTRFGVTQEKLVDFDLKRQGKDNRDDISETNYDCTLKQDKTDYSDLTDDMTKTRPHRERQRPAKYDDYVIGLILDCID